MRKNYYINIFAALVLCASISSCEDVIDVEKETEISDQAIWSSVEAADAYITASYKIFTDDTQLKGCRNRFWDSFSDLTKSSSWDQYGHPYNSFLLQGLNTGDNGAGAFECWTSQYARIRTANLCLKSLRERGQKVGQEFVTLREAEIRLCRAYSYFMLARVYGGVLLRTESSGINGGLSDGKYPEDVTMARSSEADTYEYILNELKFAAENLPDKNSTSWPRGRATKAFAYGMISRVALFAQKWEIAAEAAEAVAKCPGVQLDNDFNNVVSEKSVSSPEILFAIEYIKGNTSLFHLWDNSVSPLGDSEINKGGAYAEHQPTAELADLYEWKDGTPFSWDNWSDGHPDPFSDREPRFQATILYNGAKWRDRNIECWADYKNDEGETISSADGFAEFRKTGSTGGKTCTGYFLRKFLQESNTKFVESLDKSITPDIVMRYAEILLNEAEAYTRMDLVANREKVKNCINAIRARVQLPELPITAFSDVESAMKIIRDERAKELVAEGFRFWDLRRWGLAESVIGGQMAHGVKIINDGAGNFTYEKISCDAGETRVYPARYKYFSIPLNERSNNPLCINNPGW